jgi:outer membrane lipoprotein-sorting protein
MISFLRTASTRRLLAVLAGVVIAAGGGAAIAVAAASGGPVPRSEPLATALHQALGAPQLQGISADISFTNHLIASSDIQGDTDPLLLGGSGRLWYSPAQHRLRIELQSSGGDSQVLVHGRSFWISDANQNVVYEGTLPQGATESHSASSHERLPSIAQIQRMLTRLAQHADLTGAIPGDTGGAPTYTVRISPKHSGGLLGAAQLAFDASRGVPLDFAVYASGNSSPVLELQATSVSFGPVSRSVFAISPPSGAKIVRISTPAGSQRSHHGHGKVLHGLAAVRQAVSFGLVAPSKLVGLPRHGVAAMSEGGKAGALLTYGQGLGAILVIEAPPGGGLQLGAAQGSGHGGLTIPTVSIDGATAHELATALGTVLSFQRGGVSYTVLGSVPPAAAEAAARAL